MGDIHDDLREVMGLLGKATPGDWRYAHVEAPKSWAYVEAGYQQGVDICTGSNWSRRQHAEGKGLPGVDDDFKAIAAAVNFLRQHGPALLAAAKYEEANPLGGPATMLEAAARRVRAGEDFHEVLADYGLLARQEGEDAEAWRSIETLVRDGRRVLTWHDAGVVVGNPQHFAYGQRGWVSTQAAVKGLLATEYCDTGKVTHWRPLPAPPAARSGGGG